MFRSQAARAQLESLRQDQVPSQLSAEQFISFSDLLEDIQEVFEDVGPELVEAGFRTAVQRLEADTPFNPEDPDVRRAVRALNAQADGIAKTTRDEINEAILEGVAENESVQEIQARVRGRLRQMADSRAGVQSRARRIASTTTTTAFEQGQRISMEKAGMAGKRWLSQRDTHVRPAHLSVDGQARKLGKPFDVMGEKLQFPGDPSGSARNVVNCRCTSMPIPTDDLLQEAQEGQPDLSDLPQLLGS